eukprot:TRINITY_DN88494_c1_g1_i1.p1 TRINITY_DN88494_c1_g1~~TRINITY_DN88494_c1_g1_i1.p1  ORF type:complete len:1103 (+),score=74.15 TRINITY_DN88494_c1_g1_i1:637-3945(+)
MHQDPITLVQWYTQVQRQQLKQRQIQVQYINNWHLLMRDTLRRQPKPDIILIVSCLQLQDIRLFSRYSLNTLLQKGSSTITTPIPNQHNGNIHQQTAILFRTLTRKLNPDRSIQLLDLLPVHLERTHGHSDLLMAEYLFNNNYLQRRGPPGCNVFIFHLPNDWSNVHKCNKILSRTRPLRSLLQIWQLDQHQGNDGQNDWEKQRIWYFWPFIKNKGFASYDSPQSAQRAVAEMNGYAVLGKRLKVELKKGDDEGPLPGARPYQKDNIQFQTPINTILCASMHILQQRVNYIKDNMESSEKLPVLNEQFTREMQANCSRETTIAQEYDKAMEETLRNRIILLKADVEEQEKAVKYINDELLAKRDVLQTLEKVLKEKQEEIDTAQLKLQRILDETKGLEHANEVLDLYKEKCKELEERCSQNARTYEMLKNQYDAEKAAWSEESAKLSHEAKSKDIVIADLKATLEKVYNELAAKDKEIVLLKSQEDVCELKVSFNILQEEEELLPPDTTELDQLRAENNSLEVKLKLAQNQITEQEVKISAANKDSYAALAVLKEYQDELLNKTDIIDKLENLNRDLEVKAAQLSAGKKTLEQRLENAIRTIEQRREDIKSFESKTDEMRSEIEILIAQCKEARMQMKQQDSIIKKQQSGIDELEYTLQQKDQEIDRREQHISRLSKQLEEKKGQLHAAHLKIQEINRSVLAELKKKLASKDRDITLFKEMIKGHYAEIQGKNREIAKLKKELNKVKNEQTMLNQKNNQEKAGTATEAQPESPSPNPSQKPTVEESSETEASPTPLKLPQPAYKEKYLKRLDDYYNAISDHNYRNNSSSIRNALWQNYNAFAEKPPAVEKHSESLLLPSQNQSSPYDVKIDVSDIIKKSIARRDVSSDKVEKSKPRRLNYNGSPLMNRKFKINAKRAIFTQFQFYYYSAQCIIKGDSKFIVNNRYCARMIATMRPYSPIASPKISIRIIPTKIALCLAFARTPASPATPIAYPAAYAQSLVCIAKTSELRPQHSPEEKWEKAFLYVYPIFPSPTNVLYDSNKCTFLCDNHGHNQAIDAQDTSHNDRHQRLHNDFRLGKADTGYPYSTLSNSVSRSQIQYWIN